MLTTITTNFYGHYRCQTVLASTPS